MTTLLTLGWWLVLLGAGVQVARSDGAGPALAVVLGLWILSAQIDPVYGMIATAVGAIYVGARAERMPLRRVAG